MLKIRLSCSSKNKHACTYAIVVADAKNRRDGKFVEKVGHYHPYEGDSNTKRCVIDLSQLDSWTQKGAQLTNRVASLVKMNITSENYKPSERLSAAIADFDAYVANRQRVTVQGKSKKESKSK